MDNKEKIEWRKFYDIKDELFKLIFGNTETLEDSSSKFYRCLCFTQNEEILRKIKNLTKEMNKQYKIASKTKGDYKESPIVINDVENIIINTYDSYSSYKIEKGSVIAAIGSIQVSEVSILKNFWGKDYQKNLKKYNLIENENKNSVFIGCEDLLKLAKAKVIQRRNFTGLRYTLNIRKTGQTVSERYKYGIIILDKKPTINYANKEAKRKHSLSLVGERVEFPFPAILNCDLFIKEKE